MKTRHLWPTVLMLVLGWAGMALAQAPAPVRIGFDGEYGHRTSRSPQAIERGILAAMEEINAAGGVLKGRKLILEKRDNRSVPSRGVDNIRDLATLPDLVGVFTGKFSPVVVECVPVAQSLNLPLLAVWSAADEIIDHGFKPSFTFRLSLKDSWAIPVMLNYAKSQNIRHVGVMLPNTAWGRSNQKAIMNYLSASTDFNVVGERWYNFGELALLDRYRSLQAAGAKAIVLVANELEGSALVRDIANLPASERLPVISHWGVTGGEFVELTEGKLRDVDFSVVQTFTYDQGRGPHFERAVATAMRLFNLSDVNEIGAPVGFAHAYDLTHLLAKAIERAGTTNRSAIRDALESLGPHDGMIRRYEKPFTDARHEALNSSDVFMARYSDKGTLVRVGMPDRKGK